jgi:tetratricopeptide (TPR) repeat protein
MLDALKTLRFDQPVYSIAPLALLLIATSFAPAQQPSPDAIVQLYREATQAEQAGNYPLATRLYTRIVSARPDLAEAHANLGNLYYLQADYGKARLSFATAVKLKPQLAGPHFFLGALAFRNGDLTQAAAHLEKAQSLDPTNPQIQLHLGFTDYAAARFVTAIDHFEKTITADPHNEDAWYHLSKAASQESRKYFDQLQLRTPDSWHTHLARAHFFEAQGDFQEAVVEYQKAAALQPSPALTARIQFAQAFAAGKDAPFTPAGEEIDGATIFLFQPPATTEIPALYQKIRQSLNSPSGGAAALYKKAEQYQLLSFLAALAVLGNTPDSYRAHQLKAQSLESAGRNDEAIAEYRLALAKNPQLRSVHFAIGNILWRLANYEEAAKELNAELTLNPNDPDTHYELGDILFTEGKLDGATRHYLETLRFAPQNIEAHLALERIYSASGNTEKAAFHLQQAAKIAPAEAIPHYRLWLLYRKQGKAAEAERERELFQKLKRQSGKG